MWQVPGDNLEKLLCHMPDLTQLRFSSNKGERLPTHRTGYVWFWLQINELLRDICCIGHSQCCLIMLGEVNQVGFSQLVVIQKLTKIHLITREAVGSLLTSSWDPATWLDSSDENLIIEN